MSDTYDRLAAAEQLFIDKAYDYVTLFGAVLGDSDEAKDFRAAAVVLREEIERAKGAMREHVAGVNDELRADKVRDVWWEADGMHERPCTEPHPDHDGTGDPHEGAEDDG